MVGSVHFADVGPAAALRLLAGRRPSAPGLDYADLALAFPFSDRGRRPPPLGRIGLVAFWRDEDSLDAFLGSHPLAAALEDGWRVRLRPLRRHGSWPGLPEDVPTGHDVPDGGPAVVVTLARTRLSQAVRFLRTSSPAERAAVRAPGNLWSTALARPPFVATCSIWESAEALSRYAYGRDVPAHRDAIAEDARKPFHHRSVFIRFEPYRSEGSLGGTNPLDARVLS